MLNATECAERTLWRRDMIRGGGHRWPPAATPSPISRKGAPNQPVPGGRTTQQSVRFIDQFVPTPCILLRMASAAKHKLYTMFSRFCSAKRQNVLWPALSSNQHGHEGLMK
eukprot:6211222-Pleurochrysis_carterae.AAC.4